MNKFIFFTFNDFSKDSGGTVRIYGILNSLASNNEVILISNAKDFSKFHKNIKHINLEIKLNKKYKRFFQFSISIFPNFFNNFLFRKLLIISKKISNKNNIIFLEYLDNSYGYFLYKNGLIKNYINDIHGIAPLEFKFKKNKKIYNFVRYIIAEKHDLKVMNNTKKIICVSEEMKNYFKEKYKFQDEKFVIVRDGVNESFCKQKIDDVLLKKLKSKYKNDNKKVIFFAGSFKDLGGVDDLFKAFLFLRKKRNDIKLLLIGDGEHYEFIKNEVINKNLENEVILFGRIPYNKLKTYQQLADVIVCPDKKHPYSEIVPHIKYFDSLASGKVVINGGFKCIKEINKNESLSVDFEPSNIDDLAKKIDMVLNNLKYYEEKYKNVYEFVCKNFTYNKFVKNLEKDLYE